MVLPEQQQVVQCKKCKISISLPKEWFQPPKKGSDGSALPFRPTITVAEEPLKEKETPGPEGPQPLIAPVIGEKGPKAPPIGEITPDDLEPNLCSACGNEMMSSVPFQCSVCGAKFCLRCPGRHTPPGERTLTAHVKYKYRMRGASQWRNEHTKFTQNLPLVVCPSCYEPEFKKATQILENEIRLWYQGLVQDEDARISEKAMPQMCQSVPDVRK
jgi:predicted nucleic acid binding AN1-type Zn finger protein